MIAGFNSIEGGDIYFNEKRINDLDPAKRNIGMVFQNYAIFPHLTVRDNVAFGLKQKKMDKKTIAEQTDKFMKLMHIDEYADRMPERLSGGQQQRVALARALVIQPDVLLMDEPLANLDPVFKTDILELIQKSVSENETGVLLSTHLCDEISDIVDMIYVIEDGRISRSGSRFELLGAAGERDLKELF
jgi:iron(III) transport system ATP-binding protein